MASNLSDDARRADILRRARTGLEEDLDDMRAELTELLPEFEQRLRNKSDALPSWLAIAPSQIRALFHLKPLGSHTAAAPGTTQPMASASAIHGILGPRTVALAAGRIETFIQQGLVDVDLNDETEVQNLVELYTDTSAHLNKRVHEARRVARDAHDTLDGWLDALLFELESQRKTDVDALEDLVGQGDIGRGKSARQEIADLWEDQRSRAAELQSCWRPLTSLVNEGLATTESGLKELFDLVVRARDGLIGANASLEPQLPACQWPVAPTDAPPANAASTAANPAAAKPVAAKPTAAKPAGEMPTGETPADNLPATEAQPDPTDDAGPTLDLSEPREPDEPTSEPDADQEPLNTVPEGSYTPGIIPLDEPTSDPETTLESSSVSDYSEPEIDPPTDATHRPDAATSPSTTQRMYTRADSPSSGQPAVPAPTSGPDSTYAEPDATTPQKAAPSNTPDNAAPLDSGEATYTQCFRIRPGYKRAGLLEVLGVLVPPALVMGVMAAISALSLMGVDSGFNPFERWPWAFSAVSASLGWLLLVPVARRWRSKWRGTKLIILRHTDVREEAALRFDAHKLSLNNTTWRWDELDTAELRRWDSPLDEVCGWSLAISTPNAPTLWLAAPESNRKKWQNTPCQLDETPYDAWQLSPYDFDTISRRAL